MRVLCLTADTYPPFRPDIETLFLNELSGRGIHSDWVMTAREDGHPAVVRDGENRFQLRYLPRGGGPVQRALRHAQAFLHDLRAVCRVRRGDYDILQVKDKFLITPIAFLVARLTRTPFCFWLSFPYPEADLEAARTGRGRFPRLYALRGRMLAWFLYRFIARRADHLFVQSEHMRRDLISKGVAAEHMTAVPMGVDLDAIDALLASEQTASVGADNQPPTVAYLGSMGRPRQLELLLQAFARVRERIDDARLLMIGGGDEDDDIPRLEAEAAQLGLQTAVTFTGFLSRRDAWSMILHQAHVCVSPIPPSPTFDVSSPTKLLEYMALGKPCVANDQPDQRQVICESGAGLAVPWDTLAFADAMVRLLEDGEEAAERGARGPDYIRRERSYAEISGRLAKRYREIVQTGKSRTAQR